MSVTDIRSRQILGFDEEEILSVLDAALGGRLVAVRDGGVEILREPPPRMTPAGRTLLATCAGRVFSDLTSLTSVVIDIQMELLDLVSDELRRLNKTTASPA